MVRLHVHALSVEFSGCWECLSKGGCSLAVYLQTICSGGFTRTSWMSRWRGDFEIASRSFLRMLYAIRMRAQSSRGEFGERCTFSAAVLSSHRRKRAISRSSALNLLSTCPADDGVPGR